MGRTGGSFEPEELGADWNARYFGVAEPLGRRRKVDGGGLDALAYEAIGEAGHGIGLEGHGGNPEQQRRGHCRPGGVAAHAEDDAGVEFANQFAAVEDAARERYERAQAREQGDVLERAYVDQAETEAGFGDEARFHSALRADEKNFRIVTGDHFARYGEGGDDMAAGAAACD
jgi:hypothetical protein